MRNRLSALHLETDAYPADALTRLNEVLDLADGSLISSSDIAHELSSGDYAVVFVRLGVSLSASDVARAPNLRLVVTPTTGLDHIDVEGLASLGVDVLSLQDVKQQILNVYATAEHTLGLVLAMMRRIPSAALHVAEGGWDRRLFLGTELAGRTMGIVGYGRLGKRVAQYAAALDMNVLAHDNDPAAFQAAPPEVVVADPEVLLSNSDVVSLHLPLTRETHQWLDSSRIQMLRRGAIVVNTARGELIDERALAEALVQGNVSGIAVDVVANDSSWGFAQGLSPLLNLARAGKNVVITPHIGGWASDAVAFTRNLVTELVIDYVKSKSFNVRAST